MVYDETRGLLYITTTGGLVQRYDPVSNTLLTPFDLGGILEGIDISPDGKKLAVADAQYSTNRIWFWQIDLTTGASQKVFLTRSSGEGGTYSVAYGCDGTLFITSTYEGSGWTPLRRWFPASGTVNTLTTITQDCMLSASADRTLVSFEESNISDGGFGGFQVRANKLIMCTGYDNGTGGYNYDIATNRNGTEVVIPLGGVAFVCDGNMDGTGMVSGSSGNGPFTAVFSPVSDVVYFSWVGTSQIRAYNAITLRFISTVDAGSTFGFPAGFSSGRMKLSGDGSRLFVSVPGGVQSIPVSVTVPSPFTLWDVARCLRMSAGIESTSSTDKARYNIFGLTGKTCLDILDATRLARKAMGIETNP
jgi:DNA-binding beta-propeller fold protein YncE